MVLSRETHMRRTRPCRRMGFHMGLSEAHILLRRWRRRRRRRKVSSKLTQKEGGEEESLFKANAVNEKGSERDRVT